MKWDGYFDREMAVAFGLLFLFMLASITPDLPESFELPALLVAGLTAGGIAKRTTCRCQHERPADRS